jgi:peptidoglycan hydrolase CwlO-like protein
VWKKLKRFLLLSVLLLPWSCVPLISYSYADVVLTDEEAQELMSEIQESRKDLAELQNSLESAETQLQDVKSDYEEQKKSYEEQLKEEKKKSTEAKIFAYSASASTLLISIVLFIVVL